MDSDLYRSYLGEVCTWKRRPQHSNDRKQGRKFVVGLSPMESNLPEGSPRKQYCIKWLDNGQRSHISFEEFLKVIKGDKPKVEEPKIEVASQEIEEVIQEEAEQEIEESEDDSIYELSE